MITKPPTISWQNQSFLSVNVFTFVGSRPPQHSWPAASAPNHDGPGPRRVRVTGTGSRPGSGTVALAPWHWQPGSRPARPPPGPTGPSLIIPAMMIRRARSSVSLAAVALVLRGDITFNIACGRRRRAGPGLPPADAGPSPAAAGPASDCHGPARGLHCQCPIARNHWKWRRNLILKLPQAAQITFLSSPK